MPHDPDGYPPTAGSTPGSIGCPKQQRGARGRPATRRQPRRSRGSVAARSSGSKRTPRCLAYCARSWSDTTGSRSHHVPIGSAPGTRVPSWPGPIAGGREMVTLIAKHATCTPLRSGRGRRERAGLARWRSDLDLEPARRVDPRRPTESHASRPEPSEIPSEAATAGRSVLRRRSGSPVSGGLYPSDDLGRSRLCYPHSSLRSIARTRLFAKRGTPSTG